MGKIGTKSEEKKSSTPEKHFTGELHMWEYLT